MTDVRSLSDKIMKQEIEGIKIKFFLSLDVREAVKGLKICVLNSSNVKYEFRKHIADKIDEIFGEELSK